MSRKTKKGVGIDPSCGDGVFLGALSDTGFKEIIGVDLDDKILKRLPSDIRKNATIVNGDGLKFYTAPAADAVVGNPPFSAKYGRITDKRILEKFELGKGRRSQAIEILFLEKFIQLASSDGIVGIILPQGIFSSIPTKYVREFILEHSSVLAVVSLPRSIFSNGTTSKTSILFVQKNKRNTKTFMATADTLYDLPVLLEAYFSSKILDKPSAFWTDLDAESFDPSMYLMKQKQYVFKKGLLVKPLGDIVSEMRCGAAEYGPKRQFSSWGIPFITAKTVTPLGLDLSKNPRYVEPGSPMDKKRAYVGSDDILFVRVGVGCSGRTAVVCDLSCGIADDWIYIIRTETVNPFYLAMFFQTKFGQNQINSMKRGTGTVTIPRKLLQDMLVPIPSVSFQETVETRYKEIMHFREIGCLDEAQKSLDSLLADIELEIGE